MTLNPTALDVLVVGGGPAGVAAARCLALAGAEVAVVDRGPRTAGRSVVGESLAPAVAQPLGQLGFVDLLPSGAYGTSTGVAGRWGPSPIDRSFLFDPYGSGWFVDRVRFDCGLRDRARASGVTVLERAVVGPPRRSRRLWRVPVTSERGGVPQYMAAPFIVDATGRAAWVARKLGARPRHQDRLIAIVRTGVTSGPVQPVTHIEAVAEGWWYALGLGGRRALAALVTDADSCARSGWRDRDAWLDGLRATSVLADALPGFEPDDELQVRPAGNVAIAPCAGPGWMAIGDAAAAHDPLAGDGVLRALTSGIDAAAAVAAAAGGDSSALAAHARGVQSHFEAHLARSRVVHRRERRWPSAQYWARRSAPTDDTGSAHQWTHPITSGGLLG